MIVIDHIKTGFSFLHQSTAMLVSHGAFFAYWLAFMVITLGLGVITHANLTPIIIVLTSCIQAMIIDYAYQLLRNHHPTLLKTLQKLPSHLLMILIWVVLNNAILYILQRFVGVPTNDQFTLLTLVITLITLAWSILTAFVLYAIVIDGVDIVRSFGISINAIRSTFVTTATGYILFFIVNIGLAFALSPFTLALTKLGASEDVAMLSAGLTWQGLETLIYILQILFITFVYNWYINKRTL